MGHNQIALRNHAFDLDAYPRKLGYKTVMEFSLSSNFVAVVIPCLL
jgi:hypothetical protein